MSDQNGYSRPKGMELFEITPTIVGGDPVSLENKIWLTRQEHFEAVRYWPADALCFTQCLEGRDIRREWDAFYRQNPTTTLQKLLEKADEIDQKYGHLFNPPIGKK